MAPDEMLELAQHLLRGPDLVRPMVAGVLGEDQWSRLGLVGVVRQPVDTYREDRRPSPQSNRRGAQRNRRQPAEQWQRSAARHTASAGLRATPPPPPPHLPYPPS